MKSKVKTSKGKAVKKGNASSHSSEEGTSDKNIVSKKPQPEEKSQD